MNEDETINEFLESSNQAEVPIRMDKFIRNPTTQNNTNSFRVSPDEEGEPRTVMDDAKGGQPSKFVSTHLDSVPNPDSGAPATTNMQPQPAVADIAEPDTISEQSPDHLMRPDDGSNPPTIKDSDRSLNTIVDRHAGMRSPTLKPMGQAGRFRILRPHARGGLGKVSVALDQELNREVALKEILSQFSDDSNARERFLLEAEITGGLEHPGIVPVYGLGQNGEGQPYYAMRFIQGDSLKKSIDDFHQIDTSQGKNLGHRQFGLRQLLDRFIDVCNAMEYAHSRGVLHRDLKPSNVMVGKYGETLVVDWGLAKAMGRQEIGADSPFRPSSVLSGSVQTMQGSAMGTPAYMSPEQAAGNLEELGPATDIYSLGATLYHILTGRPPFEKQNVAEILRRVQQGEFPRPREVRPEISRGLEAICLKGMALNQADRYPSARAMADDVEHWLADEPISAAQDTVLERLTRWARKHRGLVQAGGLSLILITLVSSVAYAVVSVANGRLNSANETIRDQNLEITKKNEDLKTTNGQLAIARTEAEHQRDEAIEQRSKASELVREASRSDFASGQERLTDGKWREAMAYLGRALRYDSENTNARDALWMTLRYGRRDAPPLPRFSLRHSGAVMSADFNPEGTRLVTASRDHTATIWEISTGRPIGPVLKHDAIVNLARFSPDGQQILSICDDRVVQVWDVETGKPIGSPIVSSDQVYTATFSPEGARVLTACSDGTAQVFHAWTGEPIGPPLKHLDAVYFASFSPDGSLVVTASADTTAQVWDASTGHPVAPPLRHQGAVYTAQFNPDGSWVVTASGDTTARIWDSRTGQPVSSPLKHDRSVSSGSFSPDGTRVVTASDDKSVRIWNSETGHPIGRPLAHEDSIAIAQFSPDGTRIVTVSDDRHARLWDPLTGQGIGYAIQHDDVIRSAAFSRDGTLVATASEDMTAAIWRGQAGHPTGLILNHEDAVFSASFSLDGSRVVTASGDATARVWNVSTGQSIGQPLKHQRSVTMAQFSPDGTRVVTASDDSTAHVWNADTGQPIGNPLAHRGVVIGAEFSQDGTRVVTASSDTTAQVWNALTGEPVGLRLKHQNFVASAHFSPDGSLVVTASRDKTAQVWDAQTGRPAGVPLQHEDAVYSAVFSPDSQRIVSASRDKTARIWDSRTGESVGNPLQHADAVYIASYSRDGKRLLTVSEERLVRIWDPGSGKLIGTPLMHESRVNSAVFSPEGTRILTANEDRTARVWDTETGQPVGPPLRHDSELNTADFSPDGTQIVSANADKSVRIWDIRSRHVIDGVTAQQVTTVCAGGRLGRRLGILEQLSAEQRLGEVADLQSSLARDLDWRLLVQMEVDPRPDSLISPNSTITRREAITHLIRMQSMTSLRHALYLDPGHPLIQIGLASLKEYAMQAGFLRDYGVQRLPKDASICREAAEMLLKQHDVLRSLQALEKAIDLEPDHPQSIGLLKAVVKELEILPPGDGVAESLDRARRRLTESTQAKKKN